MDFQTLSRRELQSLCKLNKIPANITNVAMAEALQSLDLVVGIEEFMNLSQSETADLVESVETVEASSPKAPQTRCRTSTRQKAKPTETENVQSTVTRTTRRGSKQLPGEVEESKNDLLKTPAVSRTSRKVPATTTRRNVNNQLIECETEAKEEALVENKYSTRRSTRLTEKKSAAPRVKKGVEKAVKIDSFLDQGNSNAQVEDICNAFEKLDVVIIEEECKSGEEVNHLKQESDETSNSFEDSLKISEVKVDEMYDVKPESDDISSQSEEATHKGEADEVNNLKQDLEDNMKISEVKSDEVSDLKPNSVDITSPCENENLVQKENNVVMVQEQHSDSGIDAELGHEEDTPCADSEMGNEVAETNDSSTVVSIMILDNYENPIEEEMEEMSEDTVDETVDVIPTMTEEVEDLKPELFNENNVIEKSDADSGPAQTPFILSDVMGHLTHVTPIKKATPFKNMTEEVEDRNPEVFTENNVSEKSDVTGHPTPFKSILSVVSDDKENILDEGKNMKKDENEKKSVNELSMRQLKKQLKALTLNKLNPKKEADAAGTKRTALQAVRENQMVAGGETEN